MFICLVLLEMPGVQIGSNGGTLIAGWFIRKNPFKMWDYPPVIKHGKKKHMAMENGLLIDLVGGLEHGFYDFPSYWECHRPN